MTEFRQLSIKLMLNVYIFTMFILLNITFNSGYLLAVYANVF